MPDDLKIDVPASSGVKPVAPSPGLRDVGPESEVRGGPEAPDDELNGGEETPGETGR